jgi:hypothetical protein
LAITAHFSRNFCVLSVNFPFVALSEPVYDLGNNTDDRPMKEEAYPIDISRAQFEVIRSLLESIRKKTKPREVDLFVVGCALLYVLKGGLQWRRLPKDFPKWNTRSIRTLCAGSSLARRESVCGSGH